MVDQFVMLINLKNESVVYIIPAEDLNVEPGRKKYEAYDSCEVICIRRCIYLIPVILPVRRWYYA